jgi:hypothetical protein
MFRYLVAIASALAAYSLLQLAILPVVEFGRSALTSALPGHNANLLLINLCVALLDWSACIACVLTGVALAPSKKVTYAVALSFVVAILHLAQIFVILSFGEAIGAGIIPLSIVYYGGLIVTGALTCLVYEQVSGRHDIVHSRALAAISGPSVYRQALDVAAEDAVSSLVPTDSAFFDFDLVLLEDELLKIKPDRDAYISALRLGMAIESDCDYVNCRARTALFSELMRDVSMRLSATYEEEREWLSLANGFRLYKFEEKAERKARLLSLNELLASVKYRPRRLAAVALDGAEAADGTALSSEDDSLEEGYYEQESHPTVEVSALALR